MTRHIALAKVHKYLPPKPVVPYVIAQAGLLDNYLHRNVWVQAPSGFGKTVALSRLYEASQMTGELCAWLTLDPWDSDPQRFMREMVAALQAVDDLLGRGTDLQLKYGVVHSVGPEVRNLCFEVANYPATVNLHIDGYHLIANDEINRMVRRLLQHAPQNFRIRIASQQSLPTRLVLEDSPAALSVLSRADLAPASAELSDLFRALGVDEASKQGVSIQRMVAQRGLVAMLMLRLGANYGVLAQDAMPSASLDFPKLLDLVLSAIDEDDKKPLYGSAIRDRFSWLEFKKSGHAGLDAYGRSCSALTDIALQTSNAGAMRYSFPSVIRDHLRAKLQLQMPKLYMGLHMDAALEAKDDQNVHQELHHYLCAGNKQRAAQLLSQNADWMVRECGESRAFEYWAAAIGDHLFRQYEENRLALAWLYIFTGRYLDAQAMLDEEDRLSMEAHGHANPRVMTHWATLLGLADQSAKIPARLARYMGLQGQTSRFDFDIGNISSALGYTHLLEFRYAKSREEYTKGAYAFDACGSLYGKAYASISLSYLTAEQGYVYDADVMLSREYEHYRKRGTLYSYSTYMMRIAKAAYSFEMGNTAEAEKRLKQSFKYTREQGNVETTLMAYATKAKIHLSQGDFLLCEVCLVEGIDFASSRGLKRLRLGLLQEYVHACIKQGDCAKAVRIAEGAGLNAGNEYRSTKDIENPRAQFALDMASVRIQHAMGLQKQAYTLLSELIHACKKSGSQLLLIQLLSLKATYLLQAGQRDKALQAMSEAEALAKTGKAYRSIVDQSDLAMHLYEEVLDQSQAAKKFEEHNPSDFMTSNIDLGSDPRSRTNPAPLGVAIGPAVSPILSLTERELQLIQMIDQGLQNKAIAERLYISEATVKWHLQRLFAKLEVKSRSAAVARVRAVKNANYGAM
ncbi:helix-turn-helix transcriptional regulator [Rhodoferax aquaticus]|uniref:HTH luxR-type domain-containing protein n=1 Tax=Rhodoferax aquaticus TaxID=2527691 RepID=A0A515ES84_9BURK|nr:LuxR C-terminal-related transcriptional regulator [Rhodoferax aquaticus]QDL55531.1 hypothetical protein EXZ61_15860 [Rhodoferax aquaticus]